MNDVTNSLAELPGGTVTFLFTDIVGSTKLWEREPDAAHRAMVRHDRIFEQRVEESGGRVVHPRGEGDSRFAVFRRASDALVASAAFQQGLHAEPWPITNRLQVRVALHTGEAEIRAEDYYGSAVNRCARLRSIAHGGQVLLSESTYDLVRDNLPPPLTIRDLGLHRLKDLIRPEHVYQLVHPDLPCDFPPPTSLDQHPHNLPVQPTPIVGREREVAALCRWLRDPHVHLLTLTGSGGTGKTRLALQVAAEVLEHFEDGVYFVPLAALREPGLVNSTIGHTLGQKESAGVSSQVTVQEQIGAKHMLLVLDNFEQVVEAAPNVAELLATCPKLNVLVTSRIALHIRAEHEVPVPPLSLPERKPPPHVDTLSQYGAVQLFIERAQAVNPGFTLTHENAPSVAEICARLDGLPLAIELAAARVKMFPPRALLARLGSRLKLLTGGARDLPERHRTLRNTIAWSYELLNEGGRAFFRRLAVFAGGCTMEAAEAVCSPSADSSVDALDDMAALLNNSLLRQEDQNGEPRFLMLETIREYGLELLAERGEDEAVSRRHALYFLAYAERAEPHLLRADQVEWLDGLETEHGNLRAAMEWALRNHQVEIALRLSSALWPFWVFHGYVEEGWEHLSETLAQTNANNFPLARAKIQVAAGAVAYFRGDHVQAAALCSAGLPVCRAAGEKGLTGISLGLLGNLSFYHGNLDQAMIQWEESLGLARESRSDWLAAVVLSLMGILAVHTGETQRALNLCQESVTLARRVGEKWVMNQALYHLGLTHVAEARFDEARSCFLEGISLSRDIGYYLGISLEIDALAGLSAAQRQFDRAARLLGAGSAVRAAVGAPVPPAYQTDYERIVAGVRRGLGDATFAKAWSEGSLMTVDQAIAYVRTEV